ncbi:nuclear transport factor 2 family protein [Variovorax beijingensis]|nr:nuclear transport factor 2 family protein [Variovorax beijingensis]
MPVTLTVESMSPEQRELWGRVCQLWEQSRDRDRTVIGAAIHPQYVGWDMSAEFPHDKEAAIASVTDDTPALQNYELFAHSVQIYDHMVGVVHYSYRATVQPGGAPPVAVTGKWTEVYLRQNNDWKMIAVSGRPNPSPQEHPPNADAAT